MNIKKISNKQKNQSVWSGGTTTQLYIYPENAIFADRNFDFRISSAIIEIEESDFTPLPGFSRILMILEGELEICHKGHYSKKMKQFDIDEFSGDWNTSSNGKVVDFNLIMGEGISGSLEHIVLKNEIIDNNSKLKNHSFLGYYLISGEMKIIINNVEYFGQKRDMILIESKNDNEIDSIQLKGEGEIVKIIVFRKNL